MKKSRVLILAAVAAYWKLAGEIWVRYSGNF